MIFRLGCTWWLGFLGIVASTTIALADVVESPGFLTGFLGGTDGNDLVGNGVLISRRGHILTSRCVFELATAESSGGLAVVRFSDGTEAQVRRWRSERDQESRECVTDRETDVLVLLEAVSSPVQLSPIVPGLPDQVRIELATGNSVPVSVLRATTDDVLQAHSESFEIISSESGHFLTRGGIGDDFLGAPVLVESSIISKKLIGMVVAGSDGNRIRPIDEVYSELYAAGLNPLAATVANYEREIGAVRSWIAKQRNFLHSLETGLEWKAQLCRNPTETDESAQIGLVINYTKRFVGQATPQAIRVEISPGFEPGEPIPDAMVWQDFDESKVEVEIARTGPREGRALLKDAAYRLEVLVGRYNLANIDETDKVKFEDIDEIIVAIETLKAVDINQNPVDIAKIEEGDERRTISREFLSVPYASSDADRAQLPECGSALSTL